MRTRLGLKALGLSALLMGMMAIGTAGVAQAETGACWGYRASPTGGLSCFSTTLEAAPLLTIENAIGVHPSAATLLVNSFEITCTAAASNEGGQLSANGSILLGRILFSGCFIRKSTAKGLELIATCKPTSEGVSGTIRTEKATGLIVLHNGLPLVKISPDTGTTLAVIRTGPLCPIGEEIPVTGNLALIDAGGATAFETHALTHLIVESALELMKIGINTVHIDGSAEVKLSSPHNTLEWAGKPA